METKLNLDVPARLILFRKFGASLPVKLSKNSDRFPDFPIDQFNFLYSQAACRSSVLSIH